MEKQSMAAAILCTADYLSSIYVFGQTVVGSDAFAQEMVDQMARNEEIDVTERAWETLCGWIAANQNRFQYDSADKGESYGRMMKPGEYHVIATIFNDVLQQAGFSPRRCMPVFAQKGYIESWLEEKSAGVLTARYTKKSRIGHSAPRCVVVTGFDTQEEDLAPAPFG